MARTHMDPTGTHSGTHWDLRLLKRNAWFGVWEGVEPTGHPRGTCVMSYGVEAFRGPHLHESHWNPLRNPLESQTPQPKCLVRCVGRRGTHWEPMRNPRGMCQEDEAFHWVQGFRTQMEPIGTHSGTHWVLRFFTRSACFPDPHLPLYIILY